MFNFFAEKFSSLFQSLTGKGKMSPEKVQQALHLLRDTLTEADVPFDVIEAFITDIHQHLQTPEATVKLTTAEQVMNVVYERLKLFLGGTQAEAALTFQIPSLCMVIGLQGSGKTTTVAKLARLVKKQAEQRGKKRELLLASVDYYRPAAIDQLEILAQRSGIDFYRAQAHEPIAAAREIYEYSKKKQYEIVFLDTAGRMHVDDVLLQELQQIAAITQPKYTLLVVDGMIGQESLKVAQAFEKRVPTTGAVVTKMDSGTRAGVVFAYRFALKKPIFYLGTGEGLEDIEHFHPDRIARRMLGQGDVMTLVEKAQEKIKQDDQTRMQKAFEQGNFTLNDFAQQMEMMASLGSLKSVMGYLPSLPGMSLSAADMEKGEREIKKFKAILSSMTSKERLNHKILDASRKQRIATGAGVKAQDISILLERFEQSQQFAKLLKRMKRF